MSLIELFCDVDDFCQVFLPIWEQKQVRDGSRKRLRKAQLSISEIMTIIILFHQSNYRTFKAFQINYVQAFLKAEFPGLVSYPRFVALMLRAFGPFCACLYSLFGECLAFLSMTQPLQLSATIDASLGTKSLQGWPKWVEPRWVSSTVSNSNWLSMTKGICWLCSSSGNFKYDWFQVQTANYGGV